MLPEFTEITAESMESVMKNKVSVGDITFKVSEIVKVQLSRALVSLFATVMLALYLIVITEPPEIKIWKSSFVLFVPFCSNSSSKIVMKLDAIYG